MPLVIYFCFAHKDTACFEFDGEKSVEIVLETSFSHRRGGVGVFQTEVENSMKIEKFQIAHTKVLIKNFIPP